jgi:hypothetical protein
VVCGAIRFDCAKLVCGTLTVPAISATLSKLQTTDFVNCGFPEIWNMAFTPC